VRDLEKNIADFISRFRKKLRRDAGRPLNEIDLNAALLLADALKSAGATRADTEKILGKEDSEWLKKFMDG
jgi:hypothetical protein